MWRHQWSFWQLRLQYRTTSAGASRPALAASMHPMHFFRTSRWTRPQEEQVRFGSGASAGGGNASGGASAPPCPLGMGGGCFAAAAATPRGGGIGFTGRKAPRGIAFTGRSWGSSGNAGGGAFGCGWPSGPIIGGVVGGSLNTAWIDAINGAATGLTRTLQSQQRCVGDQAPHSLEDQRGGFTGRKLKSKFLSVKKE